jgi:hypothetical protein
VAGRVAQTIAVPRIAGRRVADLLTWTPLVLAAAYLLTVAIQFNQIVAATYLDADAASAPMIGQLYGGSPAHREVVLGQMAWFSTLMFELATRWLPLHREIWEAAPYAMALASVALIAWGLWQLAGRWAAAIGGVLVLCAAPHTLHLLFSLNDHSPTWFSLALLAGLLVALERRADELSVPLTVLAVLVVGAIVGANMASDTLLIAVGVLPALLATTGAWALAPGARAARAWLLTLATVAVAAVGDILTRALMHHENVTIPAEVSQTALASGEAVASNFKLWWQSIAVLGSGNFFSGTLGFTTALEVACAVLALTAVVVLVPRIAWQEVARAWRVRARDLLGERQPERRSVQAAPGTAAAAHPPQPASAPAAARIAWCIFWGSSAVLLSFGFIVSAVPVDIYSDRYLVGLIYAAAALVPLLAGRSVPRRLAIAAGTVVFALSGLVALWQGQVTANIGNDPSDYVSGLVAQIARREHLQIGYAGYWDAAPITWATHLQVHVYPVQACGAGLCPFDIHYISSWYTPQRGIHTFLISDPTQPVAAPPVAALGKPIAVHQIDELTMYVYSYDIASRLQP